MKQRTILILAMLSVCLAGCKSKQQELMDARMAASAATSNYVADCPNLDPDGKPDPMFGKPNHTPKCEAELKHSNELRQKIVDLQKEVSR